MEQGSYSTSASSFNFSLGEGAIAYPSGFAVLTQTCDLVRERGPIALVSLVELNAAQQANLGGGKSPRYFHVTGEFFADFDRIAVIDQQEVAAVATESLTPMNARAFRQAAARKFGRAPIPTHVDDAVRPFRDWFKKRAGTTTFVEMIRRVSEIRISVSPDWEEDTEKDAVELTLLFEPGDLAFPKEIPVSEGVAAEILNNRLRPATESLPKLASLLRNCEPGSGDDLAVWEAVAEHFAQMLAEEIAAATVPSIHEFVVNVRTKVDMNVAEFERTERLDLSHLSSDEA